MQFKNWGGRWGLVAMVTPLRIGNEGEQRGQNQKTPTFSHLVEDHVDQDVGPTSSCTITARAGERPWHRIGMGGERERGDTEKWLNEMIRLITSYHSWWLIKYFSDYYLSPVNVFFIKSSYLPFQGNKENFLHCYYKKCHEILKIKINH